MTSYPITDGDGDLGALYIKTGYTSIPKWAELFGDIFDPKEIGLETKSARAVLIINIQNRKMCLTFGHAHFLLEPFISRQLLCPVWRQLSWPVFLYKILLLRRRHLNPAGSYHGVRLVFNLEGRLHSFCSSACRLTSFSGVFSGNCQHLFQQSWRGG